METYTKIKYTPLKYRSDNKSISLPKDTILNSIGIYKYKRIGPQRDNILNSNTMYIDNINYNTNTHTNNIKNKNLNFQYYNIGQSNIPNYKINLNNNNLNNNYLNNNNNLNNNSVTINPLNKTTPHYYSTKLKDKILNNLRDNFQPDKIKKKKALYVNVNFNVNQNYTMPNYQNKNRSLSVQNNQNKTIKNDDNINKNLNKKKIIDNKYNNNINGNYFESFYESNKNKILKSVIDKEKQIINQNKNYIYNNNQNKNTNLGYKRNPSYTKMINNKSLDLQIKESKKINIINKNNSKNINNTTNINKINNLNKPIQFLMNNKNKNLNLHILTEQNNNINNKINNKESQINYYIYNLELKMQKLLGENKTESKGKNYNIVRKIFEESLNIMNLTQIEKNFLKLIMIKYHDIVYAFSQENKALKQSSENMSNLNFSLDKKYIDLDKKYKLLLKENEEMKKIIASQKTDDNILNNENNNTIKNNNNLHLNEINNNMYKSIKDMDFIINENSNNQKEENKEKQISDINIFKVDTKINNNKVELKEKNISKSLENNNNSSKIQNHKLKIDKFNKMNVKDLDSLYFNDKVNNINCQNSKKNYDKVPKIKFSES